MSDPVRTVHAVLVRADRADAHAVIAEVTRWPAIFAPTVHVELSERGGGRERFTIWAVVNGTVVSWTSRRTLDPDTLRITFEQEHATPPIRSMAGSWEFLDRGAEGCEVRLHHEFRTLDGGPESARAVQAALDHNSAAELAAVARVVGSGLPPERLVATFRDVVDLEAPVQAVYDFLDRADRWPERLPHVRRADLDEPAPGVQQLDLETVTADGSTHTTRSVRLCSPGRSIRYKQTTPPTGLLGHSGAWLLTERDGGGCRVTAEHTVAVDPDLLPRDESGIEPGASAERALERYRAALGGNSRATLDAVRRFATA